MKEPASTRCPDHARFIEPDGANFVVIEEITGQKQARNDKRAPHGLVMRLNISLPDEYVSGDQQHRGRAVQGCVDGGEIVNAQQRYGHQDCARRKADTSFSRVGMPSGS